MKSKFQDKDKRLVSRQHGACNEIRSGNHPKAEGGYPEVLKRTETKNLRKGNQHD